MSNKKKRPSLESSLSPYILDACGLPRFDELLESLTTHPHRGVQEGARSVVSLLETLGRQDLVPWEWINYLEGSSARSFTCLKEKDIDLLDDLTEMEIAVVYRWLLERLVKDFGKKSHKRGKSSALDLVELTLHKLMTLLPRESLVPVMEALLPWAGDHKMASDLYHWLFSHSFLENPTKLEPILYAGRGLERAKSSGDKERIAWSYYNMAHYYSHFDGEQAETLLDEAIDYLRDERYFDILGTIAVKYLESGREERAIVYLDSVYLFLQRQYEQGTWDTLDTMVYNLVYYSLSLALALYHKSDFLKSLGILDFLLLLLEQERRDFILLGESSPFPDMDWKYQYYSFRTETYLWNYACLTRLDRQKEVDAILSEFRHFLGACPYPMDPVMDRFFEATQIPFPWKF